MQSLLRSTKEEHFLISWATCDRVGFMCTQAKADPCFFVRSVGRPGVHLFSAILNDVTISLRKGCCLENDVTISLRKGCCLVLRSLSDVRERGCSLVNKLYCPFIAVWSVSYFVMLLNSFVGVIYQGLRKVCATSGPCISTRTWFVLNGSPCLIELTRCGRKTNQPSSIAWRPLCQPSRCGRKTNQPSSIAWRPLCQPTRCGRKTKPSSVAWWPLCQATRCGRITNQSISSWPLCQSTRCGRPLSQLNCIFNSAVLVSNKVHQNGTILSVRSGTQNPSESLITGSKNCTAMTYTL